MADSTTVYRSGDDGYHTFRIPSLIMSSNGVLMAFCEGRQSRADHSVNDIVLKRSSDKGKTWNDLQLVVSHGEDCLNNPQALELSETARMIMVYQRHPAGFDEKRAVPGIGVPGSVDVFLVASDDDGATWSEPRDITTGTKRPEYVTSLASGPGVGIELREGPYKGRLIMPFNQGPYGDWKVYAAFSDDRGETWRYGATAPEGARGRGNEVQMAEISGGRILLNCRSQGGARCRKQSVSEDGGETWSPLYDVRSLKDPQCMGSVIRHGEILLFSNACSRRRRAKGKVKMSRDEGKSWRTIYDITQGCFAYSCLAGLDDRSAACLYETGNEHNYERIDLVGFDLDE